MVTTKLMTAEDLERFEPGDDYRYELIRGELKRMSPAGFEHGRYVRRINIPLSVFVEERELGEVVVGDVGFVLAFDPDIVLAPDIAFVRADQVPPEDGQDRFGRLAPDLVIEVRSPSDRPIMVAEKVDIYLAAGVRAIWYFDPKRRRVLVHVAGQSPVELRADEVLDGGDIVPGFRLQLADVFK